MDALMIKAERLGFLDDEAPSAHWLGVDPADPSMFAEEEDDAVDADYEEEEKEEENDWDDFDEDELDEAEGEVEDEDELDEDPDEEPSDPLEVEDIP